jgi:hypothetical protein
MQRTPRVTLGVPLYNAERYLEQCLDAVLAQEFTDFEVVVSDNASTDATWEICQRYAAADPRFRLYRNERNLGGHANFARVVELARGELFKWVAYDDVCLPGHLRACVAALDAAGPETVLAYPRTVLIDSNGAVLGPYADRMDLRDRRAWRRVAGAAHHVNLCHAHFGVFRTAALRRTGLIRPYLGSDYTLVAEVARLGRIHEVPEELFQRRVHQASSVQGADGTAATAWFAPGGGGGAVGSSRRRMLTETTRALAGGGAPLADRVTTPVAFLAGWGSRRARVLAGHWRRRLRGQPTGPRVQGSAW